VLKSRLTILFLLCFFVRRADAQKIIRGVVVEQDSVTVMPFVYIINKSNGNGTMSDNDGKFSLATSIDDTLICSYFAHTRLHIPVRKLNPDARGEVKLVMIQLPVSLAAVTISTFKFRPYEREYMTDIIEKSRIRSLDYANSPISALYMQYSREGKQIRKLAKIFEDLLIEEQVQKKLSREILARLTKDDHIDYDAFRRYCYYVSDYFIISHDGVDLYSRVMECYKRWKAEGR
jgi:hypothetical protein